MSLRSPRQGMSKGENPKKKWVVTEQGETTGFDTSFAAAMNVETASQQMKEYNHIFQNSPRSEGKADSDEENDDTTSGEEVEECFPDVNTQSPPAKKLKESVTAGTLDALENARRTAAIVKGVTVGCVQGIKSLITEEGIAQEQTLMKVYEQSKAGTKDLKKASAHCYHEQKMQSKRIDTLEHNVKEILKFNKMNYRLLQEVSDKLERKGDQVDTEASGSFKPQIRSFCGYCKEDSHDIGECREKRMCIRCGENNHKSEICFWKDRSCARCKVKGHKVDLHDIKDPRIREELIPAYPGLFLHFLTDNDNSRGSSGIWEQRNNHRGGYKGANRGRK